MWRASTLCFNVVVFLFFIFFLHWYQRCTCIRKPPIPITHKKMLSKPPNACYLTVSTAKSCHQVAPWHAGQPSRARVELNLVCVWQREAEVELQLSPGGSWPLQLPVSGSGVSADVSGLSPPAFVCSPRWRLLQPPESLSINVHYRALVLWCQPPPLHLSLIEMVFPLKVCTLWAQILYVHSKAALH